MAILGVDPAWTAHNPSGVALLSNKGKLIAVAPSYISFKALSDGHNVDWSKRAKSGDSVENVLDAGKQLAPHDPITIVSVDMPVSKLQITSRRPADNMVSKVYGAMWCSSHSPSQQRPGSISEEFSRVMTEQQFHLATVERLVGKSYLEVYPHTALLRLMKSDKRLPYKKSKRSKYWPNLSTKERKLELMKQWKKIVIALKEKVGCIDIPINDQVNLKSIEDALDAIICAWVGYEYANGRAESLGDMNASIWTPTSIT